MARIYAVVLGVLALIVTIFRGLIYGYSPEDVLWQAWIGLILFSLLGAFAGAIAERALREAVEQRLKDELAQRTNHSQDKESLG